MPEFPWAAPRSFETRSSDRRSAGAVSALGANRLSPVMMPGMPAKVEPERRRTIIVGRVVGIDRWWGRVGIGGRAIGWRRGVGRLADIRQICRRNPAAESGIIHLTPARHA